jgi:hypothetical protein
MHTSHASGPAAHLYALAALLLVAASCRDATTVGPGGPDQVLVGAGDIARCSEGGGEVTAALLDAIAGTVFTAGDNAYESGSAVEFAQCYQPTWGRHKGRTRPSPGNHEYVSAGAAPYYQYFGAAAGPAGRGYYSYDLGAWHILSLNSNVPAHATSPQIAWLRADLAAMSASCALAYWHHPVFSSGPHGNNAHMAEVWRVLDSAGVDLVIVGHDHHYERFAPQDYIGRANPSGVRQFVVGTGGAGLRALATLRANSEVREAGTHGVLKLTLRTGSYDWEFVPQRGGTFHDSGSAACGR